MPDIYARAAKKNAADALEKARQSHASLVICNDYQYIIAVILGLLFLRNIAYKARFYLARRRLSSDAASVSSNEKASTPASSIYLQENWFYRGLGAIDAFGGSAIPVRALGGCTWFQFTMAAFICVINVAFCLIIAANSKFPGQTVNSNIPRSFSRRCGRVAVANFPILFILAGRNNLVTLLTGFAYTQVKFYHKLIGTIVLLETLVHTLGYTGYYIHYLGMEKLHEEYTELYFKMGIAATVFGLAIAITSIPAIRRAQYEIFLVTHVVGAAVFLAGSWYHRPIIENWVWAAVAIWSFERLARLASHLAGILHTRVVLRRPLLQAEATVVSGAIMLSIPFPAGTWEAGQHCYISFWGTNMLKTPWSYGQSHPFSVVNIPRPAPETDHDLHFVLRVHKGLTQTLANRISAINKATGKPASLCVSVEGPYGRTPDVEHYESIVLVAGGSGVTHVASLLADIVQKAKARYACATSVRLVWAIQHKGQIEWIRSALDNARTVADSIGLQLSLDIYVTRWDSTDSLNEKDDSTSHSRRSSAVSAEILKGASPVDELSASRAKIWRGRPILNDVVKESIAASTGHTLVVACGPTSLAKAVKVASAEMASSALHVEIATFEN